MTAAVAQGSVMGDEPTLDKLALEIQFMKERQGESSARLEKALERLERKIDHLDFVPAGEHRSHIDALAGRVQDAEQRSKWAAGIVVSGLLVVIAGAILLRVLVG